MSIKSFKQSLKKKEHRSLSERIEESASDTSWKLTQQQAVQEIEARKAAAKGSYIPAVYLKDGENSRLRFVDEAPVITCYQHTINRGGRFRSFTCMNTDECPACAAGQNRSFRAVYRVYVESFKDKQGKMHKNECRLFLANSRTFESLKTIALKKGLTSRWCDISREGEGFQTTYVVIPDDPEKLSLTLRQAKLITKDSVEELFAPPTRKSMIALLGSAEDSTE